ncbi:hypothetical protein ABH944_004030 [Caballeronia udeis]|uniref:Transposase n=1 Tax=Caballeronia udeis TaxID=1232866 RepID=A0ABW8MNW0_9BURK
MLGLIVRTLSNRARVLRNGTCQALFTSKCWYAFIDWIHRIGSKLGENYPCAIDRI